MARTLPLTQQTSLHADGSIAAPEHRPAHGGAARLLRRVSGVAAIMAGLLLSACGGNRNVLTEPTPPPSETESSQHETPQASRQPETGGTPSVADSIPYTSNGAADGAPPAAYSDGQISGQETLGERLGRLDAQMRTAPPEDLPGLQAEYQRLLEEATGSGTIETGGPRREPPNDSSLAVQEPLVLPSSPRDRQGNEILITSYDSTLQLKGLRASELRYATASENVAPAAAEPHTSTPRPRTSARTTAASTASAERPATARSRASRAEPGEKNFVNGVAATRAGWHAEAADELPRALATPQSTQRRTVAEYSYAESLENTGKLSQAADQYLKASRSGSKLSDKSYVSYCRVLAKSGQKERARQLLVQFIGKNPKSDQVVDARQLLQTL